MTTESSLRRLIIASMCIPNLVGCTGRTVSVYLHESKTWELDSHGYPIDSGADEDLVKIAVKSSWLGESRRALKHVDNCEWEAAATAYQSALDGLGRHYWSHFGLAVVYEMIGELDSALTHYREANMCSARDRDLDAAKEGQARVVRKLREPDS